ncbi:3-hydroxyisobutyryl-CoA hydrolase-like protein 1, mitochondrial, partial [Tanacetum coccineum]
ESEAAKTNDGWYGSILKKLKYALPLSLKVLLRLIREGRYQTLDECLIREYRLTSRAISCQISSDFCEVPLSRLYTGPTRTSRVISFNLRRFMAYDKKSMGVLIKSSKSGSSTSGFGESLNQSFFVSFGSVSACGTSTISILSSKVCSKSYEALSNTRSSTGSSQVIDLPDLEVLAKDLPLDDSLAVDVTPRLGGNARRKQEWISSQHMVSI